MGHPNLSSPLLQALAEMVVYNKSRAARQASMRDSELAHRLTDRLQSGKSVFLRSIDGDGAYLGIKAINSSDEF